MLYHLTDKGRFQLDKWHNALWRYVASRKGVTGGVDGLGRGRKAHGGSGGWL